RLWFGYFRWWCAEDFRQRFGIGKTYSSLSAVNIAHIAAGYGTCVDLPAVIITFIFQDCVDEANGRTAFKTVVVYDLVFAEGKSLLRTINETCYPRLYFFSFIKIGV